MNDQKILELFYDRSQEAVTAVRGEYGPRLARLAENLTGSWQDAEECVNDALLAAWNKIPPARPEPLLPWLYTVVRRIALNRYRLNRAKKRGAGEFTQAVEELGEVADHAEGPAQVLEAREAKQVLNRFLGTLSKRDRLIFMGRYWYGEAYDTIALRLGMTVDNCAKRMSLVRKKLRKVLEKEGVL